MDYGDALIGGFARGAYIFGLYLLKLLFAYPGLVLSVVSLVLVSRAANIAVNREGGTVC